jgi:hypothetical protein
VGTFGRAGEREADVTARTRTFPLRACGMTVDEPSTAAGNCPPVKSTGRQEAVCRPRPRCDMIESMSQADLEAFRQQCLRQLARPVSARIRYGFFRNPNPVRDSNRNRSFSSMAEYRRFCEESYPEYFGYARPGRAMSGA